LRPTSSKPTSNFALVVTSTIMTIILMGCGSGGFVAPVVGNDSAASSVPGSPVLPVPTPAPQNEELAICSNLALTDVVWPSSLDLVGKRSLALGLNISGSFEGGSGWKNITNNFDGQGLSLGLLNQCLGQGSLQPLLVKMRDQHSSILKEEFSSAHYASLTGMLSKWQGTANMNQVEMESFGDAFLGEGDEGLSPEGSDGVGHQESASTDSVTWAKSNLYTDGGTTFQATWKKELQTMSAHPAYVSFQIEKALSIHSKAVGYMKTLRLHDLRSYLFLFDVNVQNGGLYAADITAYNAAFPAGSTADESTRLKKMLAIRITHVVAKYKTDVQSRKLSIINGTGIVHGSARNYSKEYCFNDKEKVL
jgi:hypothetical protein